uniref:Uncharacterized protein n=1 Tax=Coccolithus braarudii TaxID=221442 RepID=A0A7S0LQ00_9EUKA|mmetsp:Transcript_52069/g.111377  ORF Transcript_52069/g.111377 Transcript_52069/m.111377 type:complete len:384 (+) Transcript_52069:24-1175(+)
MHDGAMVHQSRAHDRRPAKSPGPRPLASALGLALQNLGDSASVPVASELLSAAPTASPGPTYGLDKDCQRRWMKRIVRSYSTDPSTISTSSMSSSNITHSKAIRRCGESVLDASRLNLAAQLQPFSCRDLFRLMLTAHNSKTMPLLIVRLRAWGLQTGTRLLVICTLLRFLVSTSNDACTTSASAFCWVAYAYSVQLAALNIESFHGVANRTRPLLLYLTATVIPAVDIVSLRRSSAFLSEPHPWELDFICTTHAFNLIVMYLMGLVVFSFYSRFVIHVWLLVRVYLVLIAVCTGGFSIIIFGRGGTIFPAPGGTSTHLCVSLLCSLVSVTLAVTIKPAARLALLAQWREMMTVPLSQCPHATAKEAWLVNNDTNSEACSYSS